MVRPRRWLEPIESVQLSLGSSLLGIDLLFAHLEALASDIFKKRMNYLGVQTSMILFGAFCKRVMKGFKNSESKFFHNASITVLCRHCQGVANAVSVATGNS